MVQDTRSTAEVVKDLAANAQTIVRKELELAKLEIQEGVAKQAAAAGMFGAAGVLGLFVLGFAGVTGAIALEGVLDQRWLAWLIVTAIFLVIAIIVAIVGRSTVRKASVSPEKTKSSIEENVAWAKQQIGR